MTNPLTSADLNMMLVAVKILAERTEHITAVGFYAGRCIHMPVESLRQVASLTGAEISLQRRSTADYPWRASVNVEGVEFFAICETAELPKLGYQVPGYVDHGIRPVKIADVAAASQQQPTLPQESEVTPA